MFDKIASFAKGQADKLKSSGNLPEKVVKGYELWFQEPKEKSVVKLKLDIIGNETLSASSDVTDNYVESNVAYQNHISRRPLVYTIEGEIGEVAYYASDEDNSLLASLPNKLTKLTTFAPTVSKKLYGVMDKATKALNFIDSLDNAVSRYMKLGDKLFSSITGSDENTLQKKAFYRLLYYWYIRMPLDIKTPWRSLKNYVITNIEFNQSRRTKEMTTIRISFKEFREISRSSVVADPKELRGRLEIQKVEDVNVGTTTGEYVGEQMCKAGQWCPQPDSNGVYWK